MVGILAYFRFIFGFFKPYHSKHRMYIVLCGCENIFLACKGLLVKNQPPRSLFRNLISVGLSWTGPCL